MSARQLGLRLLELLGLRLEEVPDQPELEATDPVDTTWCNYTWRAPDADHNLVDHVCDSELGHGDAEHVCACGSRLVTCQAAARLLRLVKLPREYDDCLWPEGEVCPRHDARHPWPAGRDCLGTCTNCNAGASEYHAPSCPHYDAAAIAEHDRIVRGEN